MRGGENEETRSEPYIILAQDGTTQVRPRTGEHRRITEIRLLPLGTERERKAGI